MRQKNKPSAATLGGNQDAVFGRTATRLQLTFYPNSPQVASLTVKQEKAILNLLRRIGKKRYRQYKSELDIPLDITIPKLSRQQAWQLINKITTDLNRGAA